MKYLLFLLVLGSIVFSAFFFGCQKPNDGIDCNEPMKEWPFPSNGSRWLFDPVKVGDTLKFKVYRRSNRSLPYTYLRTETFAIKDTSIQKVTRKNIFRDVNCNEFMLSDFLSADITGPESLSCQLDNLSITDLLISIKDKEFEIGSDQYLDQLNGWSGSLTIGGQKYNNVKYYSGIDVGSNYQYEDSTYCFYNLQYGMLKFIINDTLIYQRTLH